jgi:uncharacterized oxidoreductase
MHLSHTDLRALAHRIVLAGGSSPEEAAVVADHLVTANLMGHDSHGVGMLPSYCRNLAKGLLRPNAKPIVVQQSGSLAVWDGNGGYGQVIARAAMEWAVNAAAVTGIAVHALRNTHHIGRVGTYGEIAADAGFLSITFVNGYSGPPRVTPFRGKEGRFSTNPICIAVPGTDTNPPVILDMATSRIALGKVRVAYNEGRQVISGALVDADGHPTQQPGVIYNAPHGAVLPFGEHKGYGLALICEILAGAIGGAGVIKSASMPERGILNGWLTFVLDPTRLASQSFIEEEIDALLEWTRSAAPADPDLPVLIAGEPERISRAARERDGIEIDATTWGQIEEAAAGLGINLPLV